MAVTTDPATAVKMLAAGRVDRIVAGSSADLPAIEVADRPRTQPVERIPQQRTGLRRRRPQPVFRA